MEKSFDRIQVIKKASILGIVGNAILGFLKIITGLLTGSLALLGDGFDTATDIFTSTVSLIASKVMQKPPDKDHPYGHGRVETLATKLISFVILFAGVELARQSVSQLYHHVEKEIEPVACFIALFSICGKILLAFYKFRSGRKIESPLLIADAKNMRNDVVLSLCVLIGLVIGKIGNWWWVDALTALIVSFWILKVAFSIFKENDLELMEGYNNYDDYRALFNAVKEVPEAVNPHKVRIRKMGVLLSVDLDIEVDGNLSVKEGHAIASKVEKAIRKNIQKIYDVQVHIEPIGNLEENECYGVTVGELE